MITREQICDACDDVVPLTEIVDEIMRLITEERNQYQELVDASVEITKKVDYWQSQTSDRFVKAIKPYIKLSLSEKLTLLAVMGDPLPEVSIALNELAAEAQAMERTLIKGVNYE